MRIESRKLYRKSGVYGHAHDPYGYEEFTVEINGVDHKLHMGLGMWYSVDGTTVAEGNKEAAEAFQEATGLDPKQVEKAYWRVHPYFEDPMGPLSRYI